MLYLFNTTIMPNEGVYVNRKVSLEEAINIIRKFGPIRQFDNRSITETSLIISALGHQGSADAMNALGLNVWGQIEVNRIQATMERGDQAIALKVLGRLPEGSILTLEELEKIGFEFFHIQMVMDIPENPIAFTCEAGGQVNDKTFTDFGECHF